VSFTPSKADSFIDDSNTKSPSNISWFETPTSDEWEYDSNFEGSDTEVNSGIDTCKDKDSDYDSDEETKLQGGSVGDSEDIAKSNYVASQVSPRYRY
jgi:hypothetical protein